MTRAERQIHRIICGGDGMTEMGSIRLLLALEHRQSMSRDDQPLRQALRIAKGDCPETLGCHRPS